MGFGIIPAIRPRSQWKQAICEVELQNLLAESFGISSILAKLLINRGIDTVSAADNYLNGSLSDLPSPFLLKDMDIAVNRLISALKTKELIYIYGDYDLDGASATAILASVLRFYGANVRLFIPRRDRDGYGMQIPALERIIADGAKLIITCDNGTSAYNEISYANSKNVDVIVTDHHSLPDILPPAVAVLNPMRKDSPDAFRVLCGAGVSFMLALALRKALKEQGYTDNHPNMKRYLDLVCLGTVADIVPLTGINRILVKYGMEELKTRRRIGISALLDVSGVSSNEQLSTSVISFRIAPRLNAAGRLEDAETSVKLLMAEESKDAYQIANYLDQLNKQRQELEEGIVQDIEQHILNSSELNRYSYVFGSKNWHVGVVGIIASRVVEMVHRPSIILSMDDKEYKGSGRSIPGFDLVRALKKCDSYLTRYGGHKAAAGLALKPENLELFKNAFELAAKEQLHDSSLEKTLMIDAEIPLVAITDNLLKEIDKLRPFGAGNTEPIFASKNLQVVDFKIVGKGHLRLRVKQNDRILVGMGFRLADTVEKSMFQYPISVAYSPYINNWKGDSFLQLSLMDIRTC